MSAESESPFRRVAVLGPGLIGGSLLRAVRARYPEIGLSAWARRPESVEELRAIPGLVDLATTDLEKSIEGADCLVLAMPTGYMAGVISQIGSLTYDGDQPVLVTDVGSVKGPVVEELTPLVRARGGEFLGSHPMAGSEKKGLQYAEADLFEGAAVVITPEGASGAHVDRLSRFWQQLGAIVSILDPLRHDELVAGISHLPHLVAAALVRSILSREPDSAHLGGGGFRDTTRISAGPEEMWSGILADNAPAVSAQLALFIEELSQWKEALDLLDREKLLSFLSEARCLRENLPELGKRRSLRDSGATSLSADT